MKTTLGGSTLTAGRLGYGCWRFGTSTPEEVRARLDAALGEGMTLIETADVYGLSSGEFGRAEALLGSVLADDPGLRDRMVIATKGGIRPGVPYDSGESYLVEACEASLRRLGVDVIDLYQVHRVDLLAHPRDVAAALSQLRASGKVREVGVSNYSATQARALLRHLDVPLVTMQPQFSLLHLAPLDDGVLDLCMEHDITPLAWSPLAGGALVTGDARAPCTAQELDRLAAEHGTNRTAIALAFLMAHPARVIPLVGSTDPARIRASAEALRVTLSKADWYTLLASTGRALP